MNKGSNCRRGNIEFLSMPGPFAVMFTGQGAACHVVDSASAILDLLMHIDGGGFEIDDSRETVLGWLCDSDYWTFDDEDKPFSWDFGIGEMSHVSVVKVTPWWTSVKQSDPRGSCHGHASSPAHEPHDAR